MAANTVISASVRVTSDTREAREALGELSSQVNTLANKIVLKTDSSELKKGVSAAKELQQALQAAMSVNTGKLNLSKFSSSLRAAGTDLNTLRESLVNMGPEGVSAFNAVSQAIASTGQSTIQVNKHFQNLWTNLKKTASWQISSTIIHKFSAKLQEAVHYAMDLNNSLNSIQVVTSMTDKEMSSFAATAQRMGKELSASTLAFTDAAKIYFQQGDKTSTAIQKAAITMKAANISFNSSAKDMSEYLTAIWNSYQVGTDQLEHYVDIMAALGAKTATSMEEISTALQKVAATANNVGVGMEQMSAIIATGASVTRQSAETIGTSWNTILSRLGGLKLGQTLEDGVDLNKYSKALSAIGVNVLDAEGELREMGKVIDEVGNKWAGLSKAQQSALAQTIGGARQYTQMMAFFDNYDTYKINVELADNASGELEKQNKIWEQSTEAAIGRVKNAWQGLYSQLTDDKAITTLISGFAEVLNGVTAVIDKMGGLVPLIGLIAGTFVAKLGASGEASKGIQKLVENFKVMTGMASKGERDMLMQNAAAQQQESQRYAKNNSQAASAKAAGLASISSAKANMIKNHTYNEESEAKLKAKEEALNAQTKELSEMEESWKKAQIKQETGARSRQTESAATARAKRFIGENPQDMLTGTLEIQGNLTPEEVEAKKAEVRAKAAEMEDRKTRAAAMHEEGDQMIQQAAEMRAAAQPAVAEIEHQQQLKANEAAQAAAEVHEKELSKARQESVVQGTMDQMAAMEAAGQQGSDEYAALEQQLNQQLATLDKVQAALDRKQDALDTIQLEQMELEDKKAEILAPSQAMEQAGKSKQEDADAATREADEFLSKTDEMEQQIEEDAEKRAIHPKLALEVEGLDDASLAEAQKTFNETLVSAIAESAEGSGEEALAEAESKIQEALSQVIAKCDEAIKAATLKIGELQEQDEELNNLLTSDDFGQTAEGWDANTARRQAAEIMGIKKGEGETDEAYDARLSEAGFQAEDYRDQATARASVENKQLELRAQQEAEDAKISQAKKLASAAGEDADQMVADNSGLADIGDGAGRIAKAREQVDELNKSIKELGESPVQAADAFAELGGGIVGAMGSGAAAVAGLQTALDSSASPMERISAAVMAATAAFAAYSNIVKVVSGFQKLHTAWQQADTIATKANTMAQHGQKASFLQKVGAIMANVLGMNVDTTATNADTAATIANKLAKLGLVGAIIAAVAAIGVLAAVMISAISNAMNYDQQLKELDEEMNKLTERSNELEQKSKDNAEAMQKLSQATQDTTMTLEEQVDAINEIAGAYGVQVTALDVLSGRYETLAEEMHAAMAAEQQEITAELEAIHVKQQENVQQHVEVLAKKETSIWTKIIQWVLVAWKHIQAVGLNIKAVFLLFLSGINDIRGYLKSFLAMIIRGLGTIVSFIVKIPETIANAFIKMLNTIIDAINSINILGWSPNIGRIGEVHWSDDVANAFNQAADAMDAAAQAAHDLAASQREEAAAAWAAADALRAQASEMQEMFHAENIMRAAGQATDQSEINRWSAFSAEHGTELAQLGFSWQNNKLVALSGVEQNWAGLYQFLNEFGTTDWGKYGASLSGFLDAIGADELADTERQIRQSRLAEQMYTTYAGDIDSLNLKNQTHDFSDVYQLIQRMDPNMTAADQAYVANTLSGYDHWSEGGSRYEAAVQLGLKVADFNIDSSGLSRTEITNELLAAIASGEIDGNTIDIDTILRVRPSAIHIDATGVHIDDTALRVAATRQAMAENQETQGQIAQIQKIDKGGLINRETYEALWDTGYFESYEELNAYANKSPEQRALELRIENERITQELIEQNQQIIEESRADLAVAEGELRSYYTELEQFLSDQISNGDWTRRTHAWAFDDKGNPLTGEALLRAAQVRQSSLSRSKTAQSSYRSNYSETKWDDLKGDDHEQERNAWRDSLAATMTADETKTLLAVLFPGKNYTSLSQLSESELETVFNNSERVTDAWTRQNSELELLNTRVERGTELLGEYSAVENEITAAEREVAAGEWEQRIAVIEKATNAASAFEKAINKFGQLNATDLIALSEYDPSVMAVYNESTVDEWTEYCLNKSLEYYTALETYYANDKAKLAEIQQQKESLWKTYYTNIQKASADALNKMQTEWGTVTKGADNAISSIASMLEDISNMNFESMEKLKQNLEDAGMELHDIMDLLDKLRNPNIDDKDKIVAAATAEGNALLKSLTAMYEEGKLYTSMASQRMKITVDNFVVNGEERPDAVSPEYTSQIDLLTSLAEGGTLTEDQVNEILNLTNSGNNQKADKILTLAINANAKGVNLNGLSIEDLDYLSSMPEYQQRTVLDAMAEFEQKGLDEATPIRLMRIGALHGMTWDETNLRHLANATAFFVQFGLDQATAENLAAIAEIQGLSSDEEYDLMARAYTYFKQEGLDDATAEHLSAAAALIGLTDQTQLKRLMNIQAKYKAEGLSDATWDSIFRLNALKAMSSEEDRVTVVNRLAQFAMSGFENWDDDKALMDTLAAMPEEEAPHVIANIQALFDDTGFSPNILKLGLILGLNDYAQTNPQDAKYIANLMAQLDDANFNTANLDMDFLNWMKGLSEADRTRTVEYLIHFGSEGYEQMHNVVKQYLGNKDTFDGGEEAYYSRYNHIMQYLLATMDPNEVNSLDIDKLTRWGELSSDFTISIPYSYVLTGTALSEQVTTAVEGATIDDGSGQRVVQIPYIFNRIANPNADEFDPFANPNPAIITTPVDSDNPVVVGSDSDDSRNGTAFQWVLNSPGKGPNTIDSSSMGYWHRVVIPQGASQPVYYPVSEAGEHSSSGSGQDIEWEIAPNYNPDTYLNPADYLRFVTHLPEQDYVYWNPYDQTVDSTPHPLFANWNGTGSPDGATISLGSSERDPLTYGLSVLYQLNQDMEKKGIMELPSDWLEQYNSTEIPAIEYAQDYLVALQHLINSINPETSEWQAPLQDTWTEFTTYLSELGIDFANDGIDELTSEFQNNPALLEVGKMILQGLVDGLYGEGSHTQDQIISALRSLGLDDTVITTLCEIFDIHSPSRLTAYIGQQIVQGIAQGILETPLDLTGLEQKVFAAWNATQQNLENFLQTHGLLLNPQLGIDLSQIDWNNIDLSDATEETKAMVDIMRNVYGAYEHWTPDSTTQMPEWMVRQIYNAHLKDTDYVAPTHTVSQTITQTNEDGTEVSVLESHVEINWDAVRDDILAHTDDLTDWTEEAWYAATDGMVADEFYEKFFDTTGPLSYLNTLQGAEQAVMTNMIADAKKVNSAWDSMSGTERLAAVEEQYEKKGKELIRQIQSSWQKLKDTWENALSQLYASDAKKAKEVYDLWVNTYKAIAEARLTLLKGEDTILSSWANDSTKLTAFITQMREAGKTYEEIWQMLNTTGTQNPNLINSLELKTLADWTENYKNTNFITRFMSTNLNGGFRPESYDVVRGRAEAELSDPNNENSRRTLDVITANIEQDISDAYAAFESGDENKIAAARAKMQTWQDWGVVTQDGNGLYHVADRDTLMSTDVWSEIINHYLDQQFGKRENWGQTMDAIMAEEFAQRELYRSTWENEQNQNVTKLQSDQALVQKAMESGMSALTEAERRELTQLMADNGWNTLEEANNSLATSLDATTAALWRMRQAISDGWYMSGIDAQGQATYSREIYGNNNQIFTTQQDAEHWLSGAGKAWEATNGVTGTVVPVYAQDGTIAGYKVQGTQVLTEAQLEAQYGNPTGAEAGTAVADAQDFEEKIWASQAGFKDTQELREYADSLVALGEIVEKDAHKQMELAKGLARLQKGFSTAKDKLEGWQKTLSSTDKRSTAYLQTLTEMRDTYADLFDLDDWGANNLSRTFLESSENAELLKKALDGDNDAWNQLQANAAKDIILSFDADISGPQSKVNDFFDYVANMKLDDLKIGASIDDANFNAQLSSMVMSSYDAARAMSDGLSTMGIDAEIEEHTVTVPPKSKVHRTQGYYVYDSGSGDPQLIPVDASAVTTEEGTTYTWYTLKGAKYNGRGVSKPYAPPKSSSGGGGGGGGKKEVKEKKKRSDEIERYHVILDMLDAQKQRLEQIDKIKSRTYGGKHITELNKEIDALKREAALQEEYLREINEYLPSDRAAIAALGATFNDDGTIANYVQIMNNWLDELDAAYDRYNMSAQEEADKKALEAAEKEYEERKKILEQYETTLDLARNEYNNLLEMQNKISQATVEAITYKVDLVVDLNEDDIKVIEYFVDKMEDVLHMQDEMFETMITKSAEYEDNLRAYNGALEELENEHRKFIESNGQEGVNDADYAEQLAEYRGEIIDALEDLEKLRKEILDVYGDALKKADEELEKHTKVIEHANKVAQEYIDIMGLMGHTVDYKALEDFYNLQYESNMKNLEVQRAWVDELEKEIQYYQRRMDAGHRLTETEQKQWEDLVDKYISAHEEMLSTTKETLTDLQKAHEEYVASILKTLSKVNVAGHNDLQDVADAYSYWNEQSQLYLATGKQLYEVSKLNRQIEDSVADATTQASKERLAALEAVINAQAESSQLTEYQIQQYQLQYEMALALQQLEEAKNAKSTVRLTRDENGNYGYQYTADQDSVNAAEQNYEEVLEKIRNLTVTHANDMANAYIQARQNLEQKLAELDESDFASHEAYLHARDEIIAHYTELMDYYAEQYQLVVGDMTENLSAITEWYGLTQTQHSEMVTAALDADIQTMIDNQQEYEEALRISLQEIDDAWDEYMTRIEEVENTSNVSYDNMIASIDQYNDMINKANESALDMMDTIDETLEGIHDATNEWDAHASAVQGVIGKYEQLIQTLGQTLRSMQSLQSGFSSATTSYTVIQPSVNIPSSTNNNNNNTDSVVRTDVGDWKDNGNSGHSRSIFKLYKSGKTQTTSESGAHDWNKKVPTGGTKTCYCSKCGHYMGIVYPGDAHYATGGLVDFTGPAWVDGTKSHPELMLNADDTSIMLNAVKVVRTLTPEILNLLSGNALNMFGAGITTPYVGNTSQDLQQNVQIQAEFPNVTDHNEIEMAFNDLINQTTQYIHRH